MELSDRELETMHDEFLDEAFGEVRVAGLRYNTSYLLREADSTAYGESFNNWLDSQLTDGVLFEHSDQSIHDEAEEEEAEEEDEQEEVSDV